MRRTCAVDPAVDKPDLISSEALTLDWLNEAANRMVNLLQPRLAHRANNDVT